MKPIKVFKPIKEIKYFMKGIRRKKKALNNFKNLKQQ